MKFKRKEPQRKTAEIRREFNINYSTLRFSALSLRNSALKEV